jgi:uncharacterized BrkB/YihY/UPF0761 family membrane protein
VASTPNAGWLERGQATVERTRQRWRVVDLAVSLVTRPNYATDTLLASYFAMRLFILLFPLAYVVVAGIGLYAANSAERSDDVTSDLGLTGALADSVAEAARGSQQGHVFILAGGLVLTIWAARGGLRALRTMSALVWRVPLRKTPLAEWGGVVFALTVVLTAWLGGLTNRWRQDGVSVVATSIGLGLVAGGLWLVIAWRLPHRAHRPVDHVPGAVLVAVAAPAVNIAVQVYFAPKLKRTTTTYGVLGSSLVLLTYLIVIGWTLVLAHELSAGVLEWRERGRAAAVPEAAA